MSGSPQGLLAKTAILTTCALLTACGGSQLESASRAAARTPIQLSASEREHLRLGMRVYLESVEGITDALADNKMLLVAKAAKKSGMGMVDEPEIAIAMKLPPEFVAISLDTHQKFDALAQEAAEGGTKVGVLTHIGEILANCTACHATYRLSPQ
jgi:cytochrome c556